MNKTILLVENEENWRETITFILEDESYNVISVDGRKAVQETIGQHQIDAVIINLNLHPNSMILDGIGYRVLEYIEQHRPELPRLVLSAIEKPAKVVELFEKYYVKHVSLKDEFSGPALIEAIHRVLHKPKKSQNTPQTKIICEEIKNLLSEDKLLEAIKKLSGINAYHKESIILSQRWHHINRQQRKQLITDENARIEFNKIVFSILELVSNT